MQKLALPVVLALVFVLGAGAQDPAEGTFGWHLSVTDSAGRFLDFTRALNLESGDSITVAIKSEKDCYCYFIQRGEDSGITVLFDGPLPAQRERFFFPVSSFRLDAFYVIMTLSRQEDLERLIAGYRQDPASPLKANALYDAALALQTRANSTARPAAEFTSIGGATTRGSKGGASFQGVRYSGAGAYARTIIVRY
jgi:hypothetical protein